MAARITRAKKKIAAARIPYRVPPAGELPERLAAVLDVVHLVFTTGHTAPAGASRCSAATWPNEPWTWPGCCGSSSRASPAVAGLLALILLTDARRHTRTTADGRLLLLAEQDRTRWDRAEIDEGLALVRTALRATAPDPLRAHGRDRSRPRRSTTVGSHRLAADRRPVRRADPDLALPCGGAQPRHRHRRSPRPASRARRPRRSWPPNRNSPATTTCPPPAPTSCAACTAPSEARLAYQEALLLADNPVEQDFLSRRLSELDS